VVCAVSTTVDSREGNNNFFMAKHPLLHIMSRPRSLARRNSAKRAEDEVKLALPGALSPDYTRQQLPGLPQQQGQDGRS
jgi:hypothetical protein